MLAKLILSVFIACLPFNVATYATQAETIPILKIATINVPPLAYMDPDTMVVTGEVTNKVQDRAASCGVQVAFIFSPSWARAYKMALDGTADGLIPTTYTKDRLSDFEFAQPAFYDLRPSLIVLKESGYKQFTGLNMLQGKRVGVRSKAKLEPSFDAYAASGMLTAIERVNSKGLAEALFSAQAEFIVDSPGVMAYQIGATQMDAKVRVLQPSLGQSLQHLALSIKRSETFKSGTEVSNCLLNQK